MIILLLSTKGFVVYNISNFSNPLKQSYTPINVDKGDPNRVIELNFKPNIFVFGSSNYGILIYNLSDYKNPIIIS